MLDAQSSNLRADTDILECGYRPSYANSLSDTYPPDVLLAAPWISVRETISPGKKAIRINFLGGIMKIALPDLRIATAWSG
jgi:hypothetical protein